MLSIFAFSLLYVLKNKDNIGEKGNIISIVEMVIIGLLLFPVGGLMGFHMVLVSRGRTTNEQVTGKFRGGHNPFTRGCSQNCRYAVCGPHWPKLASYVPKTRTIHIDMTKVTYHAAGKGDIKLYSDNSSNGIKRNSAVTRNQPILNSSYHDQTNIKASPLRQIHHGNNLSQSPQRGRRGLFLSL